MDGQSPSPWILFFKALRLKFPCSGHRLGLDGMTDLGPVAVCPLLVTASRKQTSAFGTSTAHLWRPAVPKSAHGIDDTARRLAPLTCGQPAGRFSVTPARNLQNMIARGKQAGAGLSEGPAGGSGGIVKASGEPRLCNGGSHRRTSLRDSAPRGRSPASGLRSAPTGARRRRSARRSRSQGRHR
ncbi:hypothetical protein PMI07_006425 [Rhizobium sp. CF080]|nr:hypothetical protein PMI07_006425 [Rhizobium sp. CF080]